METRDRLTLEELLTAFDEHLRRTRGVCPGTRRDYARFVRAFVRTVFADGPVGVAEIHARDVVEFVAALTCRYRPGTVELAVSALRSFFRFLRAEGFGCHRPVARAFQPRRHPSVPRSRSRRQGNSPPATGPTPVPHQHDSTPATDSSHSCKTSDYVHSHDRQSPRRTRTSNRTAHNHELSRIRFMRSCA
jgi:hypothetical protein